MGLLRVKSIKRRGKKNFCPDTIISVDGKVLSAATKLTFEISTDNMFGTYKLEGVYPKIETLTETFDYIIGYTTLKFHNNTITIITNHKVTIEKPIK